MFQTWLDEDVAYIITPGERMAFAQLLTDAERSQFIEQFWFRRDPTPDTRENEFKQEHYRRIVYANEHFGATIRGWKSDRGRIYMIWGKPDKIDLDTDCAKGSKLAAQVVDSLAGCPPHEAWHYNYMEEVGPNQDLVFVDVSASGDYKLVIDPSLKNAIMDPYGSYGADSLAFAEEVERLKSSLSEIELPPVKFKELEEAIAVGRHEVAFNFHSDSISATRFTTIVPITVEVPDGEFTFRDEGGTPTARENIFGRISTIDGGTVDIFENSITRKLPEKPDDSGQIKIPVYQYRATLKPGSYQLEIVVEDVASGRIGMMNTALRVSPLESNHASASASSYFSATTNCSAIGGVCNSHDVNPALPNIF